MRRAHLTPEGKKLVSAYIKRQSKIVKKKEKERKICIYPSKISEIEEAIPVFEVDGKYFDGWSITDHFDKEDSVRLMRGIHYTMEEDD